MTAPMFCARRSLFLVAAALAAPYLAAAATVRSVPVRSVYDLEGEAWITKPTWVSCDQPTMDREAGAVTVTAVCRTTRGVKIPRRGGTLLMKADVTYAESGEAIGNCEVSALVRKPGTVTLSCDIPLPDEAALPVEVSGNGPGVSQTFRLPGGTLVFETTATPDRDIWRTVRVDFSYGDGWGLWDTEGPATASEVVVVDESCEAIVSASVDGPWRVVVREAFP